MGYGGRIGNGCIKENEDRNPHHLNPTSFAHLIVGGMVAGSETTAGELGSTSLKSPNPPDS